MGKNNIKVYCKNCKWYNRSTCLSLETCDVFSSKNKEFTTVAIDSVGQKIFLWKNIEKMLIIFKYFSKVKNFSGHINGRNWKIEKNEIKKGSHGRIDLWYDTEREKYSINKDFNCPLYERKWWKFWIKEKISPITKKELQVMINLDKINF